MNVQPLPPLAKKPFPTWIIVFICLGGVFLFVVPVFSVLAIYGVRKYIAASKTAEARSVLGQIAKDAQAAYEKETIDPRGGLEATHRLCPSATRPIPASTESVRGTKYQSTAQEWDADRAKNAGFACLGFSMDEPQYFQYSYAVSRTNPPEFIATAHGDLNGDGVVSTFVIRGTVKDGVLAIAPAIEETNPVE